MGCNRVQHLFGFLTFEAQTVSLIESGFKIWFEFLHFKRESKTLDLFQWSTFTGLAFYDTHLPLLPSLQRHSFFKLENNCYYLYPVNLICCIYKACGSILWPLRQMELFSVAFFPPIIINVYESECGVGAGLLSSPFVASFHLFA